MCRTKKDDKLKKRKSGKGADFVKKKRKKKMAAGMKFLFALLFTASIGLIAAGVYLMFFKIGMPTSARQRNAILPIRI